MTFCDDPRCIQCSPRNHCQKCGIGYFLDNPNPGNKCYDCSNPLISETPVCFLQRTYYLTAIPKVSSEFGTGLIQGEYGKTITLEHTSAMVRIDLQRHSELAPLIMYSKISPLDGKFSFTIEGLARYTDYTYLYFLKNSKVYIALNFTKDVSDALMSTWMKTMVLLEMDSSETSAIITNITRQALVSGY